MDELTAEEFKSIEISRQKTIERVAWTGGQALHWVAYDTQLSDDKKKAVVRYLISRAYNINKKDAKDRTPLEIALTRGNNAVATILAPLTDPYSASPFSGGYRQLCLNMGASFWSQEVLDTFGIDPSEEDPFDFEKKEDDFAQWRRDAIETVKHYGESEGIKNPHNHSYSETLSKPKVNYPTKQPTDQPPNQSTNQPAPGIEETPLVIPRGEISAVDMQGIMRDNKIEEMLITKQGYEIRFKEQFELTRHAAEDAIRILEEAGAEEIYLTQNSVKICKK